MIKCKEYLKETDARRRELDLRIDSNRAALSVLRKNGEKNMDRCVLVCSHALLPAPRRLRNIHCNQLV